VTTAELYGAVAALRRAAVDGYILRSEFDERGAQLIARRAATVAVRARQVSSRRRPYEEFQARRRAKQAGYRQRRARRPQ